MSTLCISFLTCNELQCSVMMVMTVSPITPKISLFKSYKQVNTFVSFQGWHIGEILPVNQYSSKWHIILVRIKPHLKSIHRGGEAKYN